jgi:hypothetical protein
MVVVNMEWLWIPVIIWLFGLVILASPLVLKRLISNKKHQLRRRKEEVKPIDRSQGTFFTMEEEILDQLRHRNVCMVTSVLGVFIFAFGFIALGFIIV